MGALLDRGRLSYLAHCVLTGWQNQNEFIAQIKAEFGIC